MNTKHIFLIFSLCLSSLNINASASAQKNISSVFSYPFKKAWEHKKKFAALTIITGYMGMIYLVDKKFVATYVDYSAIPDKAAYSPEIGKITNR